MACKFLLKVSFSTSLFPGRCICHYIPLLTFLVCCFYGACGQTTKDGIKTYYHHINGKVTNKVRAIAEDKENIHTYTTFYENGTKESLTVREGAGDGKQTQHVQWYANAQKKEEAYYKDYAVYRITRWYIDGKVSSDEHFKQVKKGASVKTVRDRSVTYFENGRLKAGGAYDNNNERHGPWTEYHANGNKAMESRYFSGHNVGLSQMWYEDGTLRVTAYYFVTSEYSTSNYGRKTTYFSNGRLASDEFFNGWPAGRVFNYYINGSLKSIVDYFTFNGTWLTKGHTLEWLPNGELIDYRNYTGPGVDDAVKVKDSLRAKELFMAYRNAPTEPKGRMINGKREGSWTTWYADGSVKSEENYKAGKLSGLYTAYYPNGKKLFEIELTDDVASGKLIMWDINGAKLREQFLGKKTP